MKFSYITLGKENPSFKGETAAIASFISVSETFDYQ
jgi:hypothetical protein